MCSWNKVCIEWSTYSMQSRITLTNIRKTKYWAGVKVVVDGASPTSPPMAAALAHNQATKGWHTSQNKCTVLQYWKFHKKIYITSPKDFWMLLTHLLCVKAACINTTVMSHNVFIPHRDLPSFNVSTVTRKHTCQIKRRMNYSIFCLLYVFAMTFTNVYDDKSKSATNLFPRTFYLVPKFIHINEQNAITRNQNEMISISKHTHTWYHHRMNSFCLRQEVNNIIWCETFQEGPLI